MSIANGLILAALTVAAFLAIVGIALSLVQWGRDLRALELLDKETDHKEKR